MNELDRYFALAQESHGGLIAHHNSPIDFHLQQLHFSSQHNDCIPPQIQSLYPGAHEVDT
jgi:hypothetical protein